MASIPLPALHVQTEQQSPLALYAQAQQIRNAQTQQQLASTEVQQRQLQLQDTQATTAAMREWDGKNPDDLPPLVLRHGGSSTAVFGLKNQILDWKTKAATLTKDQLDNLDKTNDIIAGHFEAVKSADDKQTAYSNAVQDLVQKGLAQPGQFPPQYQGDDWLDQQEKAHMGQKAIVEQEQKNRQVSAQESEAATKAAEAKISSQRLQAELPGGPLNRVTQDIAINTNPEIQAGKEKVAAAEGAARAATEVNTKRQETSDAQYQTAIGADERLNRMEKSYTDAVGNHNQQAMLALLTDHIGMTLGLQKGARITKDIINEAAKSQPWLAGLGAKFDSEGYLSGVTLSPGQMKQMLDLGYSARENAWNAAKNTSDLYKVPPPPNAEAVYNKRDPNARVYDQKAANTVTMRAPNGQTKQVSPDQVDHYKKLGATVIP